MNMFNNKPIWLEEHVKELISKFKSEEEFKLLEISTSSGKTRKRFKKELEKLREKRKKEIEKELAKIDRFYKILATTDKTYREAEAEVYHNEKFYIEYEKKLAEQRNPVKREYKKIREAKKQPKKDLDSGCYLEKDLGSKDLDALLNKRFKRLKISPYGDSGAAYYWVRTRYNEGKEHAFFCYLIESELKKYIKEIKLNVNYGPDLEFEYKKKKYCFDVETGKKLERSKVSVDWKYSKYKREYDKIFILVTRKSLKYKYSRYGTVLTRGKLKETISNIFV